MNIEKLLKLAQEFEQLTSSNNANKVQQAMSLASKALSSIDIYDSKNLYEIVRQISGYLFGMWKSKDKDNFNQILSNDLPSLKQLFASAISIAKEPVRSGLMTAFRLINEIRYE